MDVYVCMHMNILLLPKDSIECCNHLHFCHCHFPECVCVSGHTDTVQLQRLKSI